MPARVRTSVHSINICPFPNLCFGTLLAACCLLLVGCGTEEPILVEKVPKAIAPDESPDRQAATSRMLAAIIPKADQAYFFKVTGSDEAVAAQKRLFFDLVQSVTFDNGTPKWQLPADWTQEEGTGERIATLTTSSDPPLSVSVTSLPFRESMGTDAYLLANINRWRGQMGLAELPAEQLHAGGDDSEETVTLTLADGTEATLVNLVGQFSGGMMPGMASGMTAPVSQRSQKTAVAYDAPAEWQSVGAGGISEATFKVGDARVTVTPLSAESNQVGSNVNRWREQVGLSPLDEADVEQSVESMTLGDGKPAQYVVLSSPESRDSQEAILGAIAVRGGTMWFIKMAGSTETVLAQKPNFESFLGSLKFSADN